MSVKKWYQICTVTSKIPPKYKYSNAGWPISVFLTSITLFVQSCFMEMYDHRGHFNIGYGYCSNQFQLDIILLLSDIVKL